MSDDDTMLDEFKIEAAEMFESAEEGLLNLDKGLDFMSNFNSIFRAFHSLKGAAGMFGMDQLQAHMHKLESLFEAQKKFAQMNKQQIDYFLKGIDVSKAILDGEEPPFDHISIEDFNKEIKTTATAVTATTTTAAKPQPLPMVEPTATGPELGVVLVVESDEKTLYQIEDLLKENKITVHKFLNTQKIFEAIDSNKPDLIVADLKMQKEIDSMSVDIPVIYISDPVARKINIDTLANGAYAFLEKPLDEIIFLSICKNAISKNKAMKLIEKSITYILYQFSNLDQYLKDQGKDEVRKELKEEFQAILEAKKKLTETP